MVKGMLDGIDIRHLLLSGIRNAKPSVQHQFLCGSTAHNLAFHNHTEILGQFRGELCHLSSVIFAECFNKKPVCEVRGGRWAQLSHGTLGTDALGSLVLFWSKKREFAVKQEAQGADRLPRGTLPVPPSPGRGAGVHSSLVLLCWNIASAPPPRIP